MPRFLIHATAALLTTLSAAAAGTPGLAPEDIARFEVLPGWRTEDGTHMAALRVRLAPGWKTYWRAPGDSGIPPRFDWTGTRNLAAVEFHWPTPEVFVRNGLRTIGYMHELVLPMELTPRRAGEPIALRAELEIGVCEDVCVPMQARLAADLDAVGGPDRQIDRALARRPATAGEAGVFAVTCRVEPIRDGLRVTASIEMPAMAADEIAVFELPDQSIWVSEAQERRTGDRLEATADLVPPSGGPFLLDRSDLRITVMGAGRAVDIQGCTG